MNQNHAVLWKQRKKTISTRGQFIVSNVGKKSDSISHLEIIGIVCNVSYKVKYLNLSLL